MARSRGAKKGYEAESLASKLLVPQAVSAEPARGSHQYRAIYRNCEEGPELSSRWPSAVSGLSKSLAPSAVALSAQRLTSLASASEALKLPSPRRTVGLSTPCQKKLVVYFH